MKSPTNYFVIILFCSLMLSWSNALGCDSCGSECSSACGTRHFRTCCFNYLRKRNVPDKIPTEPTRLKLELWLSKAKSQIEKEQQLLNPQNSKQHVTPNEINEQQSHSLNHYYKPVHLTNQQQQDFSDFNNNGAAIILDDSVPSEQSRVQLIYDV